MTGSFLSKMGSLSLRALAALRNPLDNPRITIIIVVFALLLLLLISTVVELVLAFLFRKAEKTGVPTEVEQSSEGVKENEGGGRRRKYFFSIIALLTAGGAVASGLHAISQPKFCAACHNNAGRTWAESPHKQTDCLVCHQKPGILGYAAAKLDLARMLVDEAVDSYKKPIRGRLEEHGCASCHQSVFSRVVVSKSIRMSHVEPVDAGYLCKDCHGSIGHGPSPGAAMPTMDKCATCHDGKRASVECSECHPRDVGVAVRRPSGDYPKVSLSSDRCKGCHTEKTCDDCHGVAMPHPADWGRTLHADQAAFEKKATCKKCHDDVFCGECHKFPGHPADWKRSHRTDRAGAKACESCHQSARPRDFCGLCHKPSEKLEKNL